MSLDKDGIIIILSSPSGAGKTTLVKKIAQENNYKISISHTTRKPRTNEVNGNDYFFISEDEFKNLKQDNNNSRKIIYHPNLTFDGGLLFGWKAPLIKINTCSELEFQSTKDLFHHSIETDIDGNIWAPSHLYPQTISAEKVGRKLIADGGYHDDAIVKLSPNGEILFEKSVSEIFIENNMVEREEFYLHL